MNLVTNRSLLSSSALVAVTVLGLLADVSGQCVPFSRQGMREIETWGTGSSLNVGLRAPNETGLNLVLGHDSALGARLLNSSHRHLRKDGRLQVFDFVHSPPGTAAEGLWQAVLRPVADPTAYPVGPAQASGFRIFVNQLGTAHDVILSWNGLCIQGIQCAQKFWFEMRIRQPAGDANRFEFDSRMARLQNPGNGVPMTMDEVQAPIVYTLQPGSTLKSRILVPVAQNLPLPATNMPMSAWQVLGGNADLEHPARGQQMQFSALYGGDPIKVELPTIVISPFEKILYFSTEDRDGYYKRFKHQVVTANGLASYRWAPTYFPEYGPAPALNVFRSPYPAVMKGLTARTNAWWFDVCAEYREFVRGKMGLTPMRLPTYPLNKQAAGGESVVLATINLQNNPAGKSAIFADYVDHAINLQQVFKSPGTNKPAKIFMEWQKWYNGLAGSGEDLIGPGTNPKPYSGATNAPKEIAQEAIPEIDRAASNGVNICVYTVPIVLNNDDWTSFHDSWFLRDRLGQKRVTGDQAYVDFGIKSVPRWYATTFFDDILDSAPNLGGVYLDLFGGEASFLRYPKVTGAKFWQDPKSYYLQARGSLFKRKYHGGAAYVRGGVSTLDLLRGRVHRGQVARKSSERPFIPTEAVMEDFAGHYDAGQHGLKPIPGHTQMSSLLDQFAGLVNDPMPLNAAANNPPLWNAVYHEYSRAEALGMMLNTEAVAAVLGGGAEIGGVDWGTWASYNRMIHALMFIGGMKASLFSYFQDFQQESLIQTGPTGPVLEDGTVPEQGQLLAFMQRMHQASARQGEAAELLNYGLMERPLDLPQIFLLPGPPLQRQLFFFPGTVDSTFSPSPTISAFTLPLLGVTRHYNEDFFTAVFPSQMPKVLHSVWRSTPASKRLGLVLVNWSDQPAYWQGTFKPAAYDGFAAGFKVTGVRPNGAGVTEYAVGQRSGDTVMGFSNLPLAINLRHHSQGVPGLMPARSVQVFYIDPL